MTEVHVVPRAWLVIAVAGIIAVVAYWTGLQGPFLLDDDANLRDIPSWLDGRLGLSTLLFERGGGMFGRPVSMASFALNAWIGGYAPFPLKVGNLMVHLSVGLAIFCLLRNILQRDPSLRDRASLYAALVATIWLLHPLHASTVLYVVQRMAQLSALVIVLGLWLYVVVRQRLERGASRLASAALLIGIPLLTVLGFLAKENGALLPLMCAALEVSYFRGAQRPRVVRAFHLLFVGLPVALGTALFALKPERFIGGYVGRDFTLAERLLTQPRALCDYLWKLLVPNPPRMGVYTDDFIASTGILSPWTTLISILVLLAVTFAAWHWRSRFPALLFGWSFFLVAHSLEAGPIPLELYFEHRNYLPSVGILLALLALAVAVGNRLSGLGIRPGRIGVVLALGVCAVLAIGTHGRAQVWRDPQLIAESALLAHPHSLRANVAVMTSAILYGERERANQAIDRILELPQPRHRALGHAYRLMIECEHDGSGRSEDLEAFVTQAALPITIAETQPFILIYHIVAKRPCSPFTDEMFGNALARLADRATAQPENGGDNWSLRYQAASFLLRARDWTAALEQGRLAWQPAADPPVAMPLILAQLHTGDITGAERTLREVEERGDPSNRTEAENVLWLRTQIDQASAAAP